MKTNKIIILMALLGLGMAVPAQNTDNNNKQKITEVKLAEDQYIYVDQTSVTAEQALCKAQDQLLQELMDFLKGMGQNEDEAKELLKEQMVTITMQRGGQFRAFVYIDKKQVPEHKKEEVVAVSPTTTEKSVAADLPKAKQETPAAAAADANSQATLQQIAAMTSRLQVYDFITQLQKDGEDVAFVTHPTEQEMTVLYLILYKRGGTIEAILTPADANGQRFNLATGLPDFTANHPATSINGFKLNE